MSDRWPGGIIRKTPVIPTGPVYNGAASGVWTMDQAAYWQRQGLWPTQGVGVPDPSFPYVTMLLATTSLNGGQNGTFLDSSSNNFTFTNVNTPTQGSFSPYGANWSGYFDGTGDYLTVPDNATWVFSGNLTIEAWVFPTSMPLEQVVVSQWYGGSVGQTAWQLAFSETGKATGVIAIGGTQYTIKSTSTYPANQWYHLALVRNGSTLSLYVNGTSVASTTASGTTNNLSYDVVIGAINNLGTISAPFFGYVSNLRIVNGTAVYTANFTPPTQALTAITNTSLLTCAYNRFRDGSTNNFTITRNGDSKTTDFSPFSPAYPGYTTTANGGSLLFNGSNQATYVDSSNAALTLGTGDFTIELWVYQNTLSGNQSWVSTYGGPSAGYRLSPAGGTISWTWGDTMLLNSSTNTDINQWSHVAVTRQGTTVRLFKNGVVIATGTNSTNLTGGSTQTTLGRIPTYNQWYYNGYMSDVRIVKGTAVYTADFTPPTAPLTAISGTSLLAAGTNANIFDAAAMNDMTTVGNAQVSTAMSKFGGSSMAFDGTGDYLSTPSSSTLNFGTGDFTVELWAYWNVVDSTNGSAFISGSTSGSIDLVYISNSLRIGSVLVNWDTTFSTWTPSSGIWYHIAFTRNNGTVRAFVDGTQIGSSQTNTNSYSTAASLIVGASTPSFRLMNGYIDDLRITKGVARYTSNFTPPTQAFPPY